MCTHPGFLVAEVCLYQNNFIALPRAVKWVTLNNARNEKYIFDCYGMPRATGNFQGQPAAGKS